VRKSKPLLPGLVEETMKKEQARSSHDNRKARSPQAPKSLAATELAQVYGGAAEAAAPSDPYHSPNHNETIVHDDSEGRRREPKRAAKKRGVKSLAATELAQVHGGAAGAPSDPYYSINHNESIVRDDSEGRHREPKRAAKKRGVKSLAATELAQVHGGAAGAPSDPYVSLNHNETIVRDNSISPRKRR
jgi:hypothetical protein